MTVQCQNRGTCAGVYHCQIVTYDEKNGGPTAALTAEKTSERLLLDTKRLFSSSESGSWIS